MTLLLRRVPAWCVTKFSNTTVKHTFQSKHNVMSDAWLYSATDPITILWRVATGRTPQPCITVSPAAHVSNRSRKCPAEWVIMESANVIPLTEDRRVLTPEPRHCTATPNAHILWKNRLFDNVLYPWIVLGVQILLMYIERHLYQFQSLHFGTSMKEFSRVNKNTSDH